MDFGPWVVNGIAYQTKPLNCAALYTKMYVIYTKFQIQIESVLNV